MPLNTANFVLNGHLIHQDLSQFSDLLTGVMTDQPVTIANTLAATISVTTPTVIAGAGGNLNFQTGAANRWMVSNGGYILAITGRHASATDPMVLEGVALLEAGWSEEEMLGKLFGTSSFTFRTVSFRQAYVTNVFQRLLRHPPTLTELTSNTDGDASLLHIRELLEVSDEFYFHGV